MNGLKNKNKNSFKELVKTLIFAGSIAIIFRSIFLVKRQRWGYEKIFTESGLAKKQIRFPNFIESKNKLV